MWFKKKEIDPNKTIARPVYWFIHDTRGNFEKAFGAYAASPDQDATYHAMTISAEEFVRLKELLKD